ncbi:hypothetical protein DEO72_LG3g2101 [Vigna unguiculata]|uniref:Uncharacterized protein n=1 Tax=Vigna unguiculata TaxID=3917 RepID=A0A4D6LHD0_VIGUN|nr:hypothetical protein DEO72_LG3g2101 [Vigna unguiculata]
MRPNEVEVVAFAYCAEALCMLDDLQHLLLILVTMLNLGRMEMSLVVYIALGILEIM